MSDLKFLRDNWVLVITSFLILSMVSLSTTFNYFEFNILKYISFQDSITIFFELILKLDYFFIIIAFFILTKLDQNNKSKLKNVPLFPSFLLIALSLVLYIGISADFNSLMSFENVVLHIGQIFTILIIFINLLFFGKEIFPNPNRLKLANFICNLIFFHIFLVFGNVGSIFDNKKQTSLIKLDQVQIVTSKNLYILFQSSDILVLRNETERSNTVYKMDNIKSIEECF